MVFYHVFFLVPSNYRYTRFMMTRPHFALLFAFRFLTRRSTRIRIIILLFEPAINIVAVVAHLKCHLSNGVIGRQA